MLSKFVYVVFLGGGKNLSFFFFLKRSSSLG